MGLGRIGREAPSAARSSNSSITVEPRSGLWRVRPVGARNRVLRRRQSGFSKPILDAPGRRKQPVKPRNSFHFLSVPFPKSAFSMSCADASRPPPPVPFHRARDRGPRLEPNRSKPNSEPDQQKSRKRAWILLDSFVKFVPFQRVRGSPTVQCKRLPIPAKGILCAASQAAEPRRFPSCQPRFPSRRPRQFKSKHSMDIENKARISCGPPGAEGSRPAGPVEWRGQDAAQTDTKGRTRHQ